jgi:virginiamycin B lyase
MNMNAHIIGSGRWQGWRRPITAAAAALTLLSGLVLTGVGNPATAEAAPLAALGHIYWSNASGNTIGRADLDGSDVDENFISGASGPSNVLVHGQYIYWGNATACTEDGACDGSIGRASLNGTGVNEHFIPADTPYGLAISGEYIYWGSTGIGKIGRADLDGTSVNPSFISGLNQPDGVVVNGQNIYWADNGSNTIGEANLAGTDVNQKLITGPKGPEGMAIDKQYIYWTNVSNGTIGRANLDGTGVNEGFIAHAGNSPTRVTVQGQHIYWTSLATLAIPSPGTIGEANLDGTDVKDNLIYSANSPVGVAVLPGSVPAPGSTTAGGSGAGGSGGGVGGGGGSVTVVKGGGGSYYPGTDQFGPGHRLLPSPLGDGQCEYQEFSDGSYQAQIAVYEANCTAADATGLGAARAAGGAYDADGFHCAATAEGAGSEWGSDWSGTFYAYDCIDGAAQVAFNWGPHYF